MEFLKEILGDDLYKQVEEKLNAHNGDEANKEKQIKLANLSGGEYVGKGKYDALQELLKGKDTELSSANELIAQLKKDTKGNEDLQGKIGTYEQENAKLQAELAETKLNSAIKVALLSEKAVDVDYLTFKLNEKLKEKGETLELDENDSIKGWDAQLDGLKTQFPSMFGTAGEKLQPYGNEGLPKGEQGDKLTKESILKMPYNKRMDLFNADPEGYNKVMHPQG